MTTPYDLYTDQLTVFTQAVIDRLVANASTLTDADGNELEVFYGEQTQYPRTPAAAVEPMDKERELSGAPRMYLTRMTVSVVIYLTKVLDSNQATRKSVDELGERVEAVLHENFHYGTLLADSYVRRAESGYAYKAGTQYRAYRIEFEGLVKKGLPLTF